MSRITCAFVVTTLSVGLAVACRESSAPPTSPSSIATRAAGAGVDGATLKATAPVATAPVGGVKLTQPPIVLTIQNSTTPYSPGIALSYRFEVLSGTTVVDSAVVASGAGTTSRTVAAALDGEKTFQWHARAEYQGAFGPWSALQSFVSPLTTGYIRGSELYDPLNNGKTIGQVNGPVTFIPGVGARTDTIGAWIAYNLQTALVEGEFSALFTNVTTTNEEIKRVLLSMRQGTTQFNDNPYRMSFNVDSNGEFAWRFITGSSTYIQTEGDPQRPKYPFDASKTYFVQTTWRNHFFHVICKEGGVNGTLIYDFGKTYTGTYLPNPHNVYVGAPYTPGDRGERQSLAQAIVRQVWVSANPRPSFANQ
jgi:hypothetical protein